MVDFTKAGHKDDSGKLRYDLLPRRALQQVAARLTQGEKKYCAQNWRVGIPYSKLVGAAERHLNAFCMGGIIDEDGGLHELSGAVISLLMLLEYELEGRREELNDLYMSPEDLAKIKLQIEKTLREREDFRRTFLGGEGTDVPTRSSEDQGSLESKV